MSSAARTQASAAASRFKGAQEGIVDRAVMPKTRRVKLEYLARHPKYGKYLKRRTFITVHDEHDVSGKGDKVLIAPCRPMSKTKRWKVVRIVEKALEALPTPQEAGAVEE